MIARQFFFLHGVCCNLLLPVSLSTEAGNRTMPINAQKMRDDDEIESGANVEVSLDHESHPGTSTSGSSSSGPHVRETGMHLHSKKPIEEPANSPASTGVVLRGFRFFRKYGTELFGIRWKALLAEGVGTFCFLFVGVLSVMITSRFKNNDINTPVPPLTLVAFAHGMGLACAIYMTANVSGGHLNPAVTLAGILCNKMDLKHGILYMGMQLGASVLATSCALALVPEAQGYAFRIAAEVSPGQGFFCEIILTFFFVMVILATAMDPTNPGDTNKRESSFDIYITMAPLAIGLALFTCILVGGPISGGCLNPAHAFGPSIVEEYWGPFEIWIFGPCVGSAIAVIVYEFIFSPKPFSRR